MNAHDSILALGTAAAWKFGTPAALLLLIAVPVAGLLLWLAFLRGRRALEKFEGVTPQDSRPSLVRAGAKVVLAMIALSSLMVAVARPQADPIEETVTVRGRDIVFLVDVSKSMLSRDAVPSRLGRAKLWINDLVNTLKGDRVGLVAFAGVPVVKCPLTMDYGYFRMALDELSPASVPRGGTLIGDAIRKTLSDVFEPGPGRYKDIVLITDGEDQGSYADQAAQKAAEMGVRIIAIGIGSELEGSLVPSEEGNSQKYVEHDGQKVHSRLDSSTLASIASAAAGAAGENGGGGVFLNVGTGTMDLDKVYHDLIGSAERKETETKSNVTYRELFPYFLGLAAICLGIEPLIGGRAVLRRRAVSRSNPVVANPVVTAVVLGALMMPLGARAQSSKAPAAPVPAVAAGSKPATESAKPAPAPTPDAIYNSGREKFLAGQYAQAAEEFRQADLGATDPELSARARFNMGQALLKQAGAPPAQGDKADDGSRQIAQLDSAARAFRSVLDVKPGDAEAARNVEIARTLMKEKQEEQKRREQQKRDQQKQDQQKKDGDKSGEKGDSEKNDQKDQEQDQDSKQDQNQGGKDAKQSKSQQHQQNADKLKDLAQQQSQAADKSREAQDEKVAEAKEQKKQEAGKEQDRVSKETQAEKEKQEKSKDDAESDARQKMDEARKEQEAASRSLEKGDPKSAEEHQRKAAELLDQASDAEQKAADEAAKAEAEQKDKKDQAKEEKPKYNDTASQLLDKERKQREARQQVLRALKGRPQPVDKDW